jgi:hypothetical protein
MAGKREKIQDEFLKMHEDAGGTYSGADAEVYQQAVNTLRDTAQKRYQSELSSRIAQKQQKAREQGASTGRTFARFNSITGGQGIDLAKQAADNVAPYLREVTLAQKAYDDYVKSPEYRKKQENIIAENFSASESPTSLPQLEDDRAKELKAKRDYYKNLSVKEDDRRTLERNLAQIDPKDEEAFILYTKLQDGDAAVSADRDVATFYDFGQMKEVAAPLEAKYGKDNFKKLAEAYGRYYRSKKAEELTAQAQKDVETVPGAILGSATSVATNAFGGLGATASRIRELLTRTGQFHTLDPYTAGDMAQVYGGGLRGAVAENIAGDKNNKVRAGLSKVYEAGMSAADSVARAAAFGSGSLALVAASSFSSTLSEASQKGATPEQAYLMATANAGLEVLTEKVSLDSLLGVAKAKGGSNLRKVLLNTFGQAGVEISEEEASYIGGLIAEAAILQGKSEYNQTIGELVANGMSYEEAKAQANKDVWNEAVNTAVVSGLSGGISGGVATGYNAVMNRLSNPGGAATDAQEATGSQQAGILSGTPMDTTKAQNPAMQSPATPQVDTAPTNALSDAIDTLKQTGNVSNKTVEKVLADPAAVQQLKEAGTDLSQLATASEKRSAVKAAVRQLAGDTAPTTLTREGAQSLIEDMGQELAERAPARQETPEVSPKRQAVQNAIDQVLGVDTGTGENYNAINGNPTQGGIENAGTAEQGTAQGAGNQLYGAPGEGVQQVQGGTEHYSQSQESGALGQGHLRGSGEFLLSETAQKALSEKGSPDVRMYQDSDAQTFVDALNEGRNSDVKNGWCVSPKEVSDLTQPGVKSYLAENGQAGFVINNGDIEAVFTNKAKGAPKGLADSLMLRALSAGGNKLDCYGETLATIYSRYGFEPVARVEFNKTYANEGWTPDKGEPYIYVMKHNGDSADTVAQKMGTYPEYTKDQLEALPTYGKNDYDAALAYRDSLMGKGSPQVADSSGQSTEGGQGSTLGAQNAPSGDINQSKTFTNSGLNSADPDIRAAYEQTMRDTPKAADYEVKHNADTRATAQERTSTPERVQAEYSYLLGKTDWTAEDNTTAHRIISELQKNGGDGAQSQITDMQMKIREINANAGQLIQSNRIGMTMEDASTPAAAAQRAVNAIMDMDEKDSTFRQKKGGQTYKQWQKATADNLNRIGMEIERVKDGDSAGMRDIIRQIARSRKTTAWFGTSQNLTKAAETVLGTLDFDDLKVVASTQLAAMPDDFRARTKTEVAMAVRKSHMLASLKTTIRNLSGNASAGFLDAMSDSGAGQLMDSMLSKITGKRTVGNDLTKVGAYAKGATNAAKFAALCVELDIPVETDSLSSFSSAVGGKSGGKYMGKTFRPDGNVAMRAMYAFQKYMGYDLDVSDKIFEGGTNKAVSESLTNIKNSNLTDEEVQQLSEYTANRRTFKDATWIDDNGKRHGSTLSRGAVGIKNAVSSIGAPAEIAADVVLPFASVPANVAQTGIDYTVGIAKGTGEIISIIKDAKAGKNIDVVRQRQAVSDFGRGVTGTVMIAAFAAAAARGIIKVNSPKDKDEKALIQAEGRNGAQFNWSAFQRSLSGESDGWQDGDIITSFDFLEPFNTQLYLGYELAQGDSVLEALAKYPDASVQSVLNSFMDTPMMSGLVDITELVDNLTSAETAGERADAFAGYAGDTASSFIPQYLRQAAQVADGYYRDTRGDTSAEYAMNNILAAIPGLSQTLPKKISGLGEEQQRGGFLETFADPTYTKQYRKNEVTGYLEDLKDKTGDSSFFPDRQAPMDIRVDGETISLDGGARETYQKTYGNLVNDYYRSLIDSNVFERFAPEQKAAALNKAKSYAVEHAKSEVSGYTTDKPKIAAEVRDEILNGVVKTEFSNAFTSMEEEKLDKAYGLYQSLPFSQRENFKRDNSGRVGYYITAKEKGVSDKMFTSLYGTYKKLDGDKSMTDQQKAQEWSRTLAKAYEDGEITKAAHDAMKEEMAIWQHFPVDTVKFDAMTESGLSSDVADRIIKGLADLQGTGSVNKDTGEATVTNRDKWGYIAALDGLSDKEKDRVMLLYMPDYNPEAEKPNKTELKYAYLRSKGYSAEQFTQTYSVTQEFTKKADMIAAWVALGYSSEEAQMFYRLYKAGKIV